MKESTLIIDRHGWRKRAVKETELGVSRTFGFWTFTYCPFLLSAWLEVKMDLMRSILRSSGERARNAPDANQNVNIPKKFSPPPHVTTKPRGPK